MSALMDMVSKKYETEPPAKRQSVGLKPHEKSSWSIVGQGLVGRNLTDKLFSEPISRVRTYSRRRKDPIKGDKHGTLVIAGASSAKRLVNADPDRDMDDLQRLVEDVEGAEFDRLVLISSIDARNPNIPYGRNRLWLEKVMVDIGCTSVVRLPTLFGRGLQKNILFDLLNRKLYGPVNSEDVHQWYDLTRLADDIAMAPDGLTELYPAPMGNDELMDLIEGQKVPDMYGSTPKWVQPKKVVRPIAVGEVLFGAQKMAVSKGWSQVSEPGTALVYDVVPRRGYLYGKDEVRARLTKFINSTR